jgi:RNA polymerase sigma factor for flagellar operon FliA
LERDTGRRGDMHTEAMKVHEGAVPTKEKFYADNAQLVRIAAFSKAKGLPSHIEVDDLISAGTIGLLDAIEKFDESKGASFKTYASIRINGAIKDELRRMDWMSRPMRKQSTQLNKAFERVEMSTGGPADFDEVARSLEKTTEELHTLISRVGSLSLLNFDDLIVNHDHEVNILDCIKDPNVEDPADTAGSNELRKRIMEALEAISEKERLVITLYYYEELTLREIGTVLGYSEGRACQLLKEALQRLRVLLGAYA